MEKPANIREFGGKNKITIGAQKLQQMDKNTI